jgi:hypothetical protein
MEDDWPELFETPEIITLSPTIAAACPMETILLKRLGYGKKIHAPPRIRALISSTINQVLGSIQPKAIAAFAPVSSISDEAITAGGSRIESRLWAHLARQSGYPMAMAFFALTLGALPDHALDGADAQTLSDRYLMHEAAALAIEVLADHLSNDLGRHRRVQDLRDRKSTRLNSSHRLTSRMPSSA